MALQFTTSYVEDSITIFRYYKKLAERAMEQVSDDQLLAVLDDGVELDRAHRETHVGQHAVALDRFSDH